MDAPSDHTKDLDGNQKFLTIMLERMEVLHETLRDEVLRGRVDIVKVREARQTLMMMRDYYNDKLEQVSQIGVPAVARL